MDHQGGQKGLAGALVGLSQRGGELQGEGGVLLTDLDRGLQPQHVVDGALGEPDGTGDGGADDILSLGGVSAVALDLKARDTAPLGKNVTVVIRP